MKKKTVSILLILAMLLALVACATPKADDPPAANDNPPATDNTETNDPDAEPGINADGLGGYKIGFWYAPPTDSLSKGFRDMLDYCAEMTNCEMVYYDMTGWSAGDQATAVETLVAQGCDAVIMVTGQSPAIFQYLNDNEVYYVGMTRSLTEEVKLVTQDSEYCTGWTGDLGGEEGSNYATGYMLTESLAQAGCKKIAYVDSSEGETMGDERCVGILAAVEDYGMEAIAKYRGTDGVTGFADILSTFGADLDGIVFAGGSGDMAIAAIQAAGYMGKIKLAQGNDAGEETRAYLENGMLQITSLGGATFMAQMYMQLFNALSGADRLFNTGHKIFPPMGGLIITTPQEWDGALQVMDAMPGGMTPPEILSLNSLCAPGMTLAEREELALSYATVEYWSVEGALARIAEYKAQ